MEINQMIKENRKEHQLTQEQLAETIFVSKKTISNWETGKTTPDLDSLIRLANLFDLSLDNLLIEGSNVVDNIKSEIELNTLNKVKIISFINILFNSILLVFLGANYLLLCLFITVIISCLNVVMHMFILDKINYIKTGNRLRKSKKFSHVLFFTIGTLPIFIIKYLYSWINQESK